MSADEASTTKSLHVQLNGSWYNVRYPFSPSMKYVLEQVFRGREYPTSLPPEFSVSTIVDVGGNVGAAAIWFHACHPESQIFSFEPSPSAFKFLEENTSFCAQIDARNYGLLDRNLSSRLHVGRNHPAQSSLCAHDETAEDTEAIELRRASAELDSLAVERVSILKVDTEGAEVPILSDLASAGWLERIDVIYVEYHSEDDRRAIDTLLADHFYLTGSLISRGNLGTLVYYARRIADTNRKLVATPIRFAIEDRDNG